MFRERAVWSVGTDYKKLHLICGVGILWRGDNVNSNNCGWLLIKVVKTKCGIFNIGIAFFSHITHKFYEFAEKKKCGNPENNSLKIR